MNQSRVTNEILHDWIHEQDMDHVAKLARDAVRHPKAEDYPAPESLRQAMFGGGAVDGTLWNTYQRVSGSNPAESQSLTIWARMNSDWTIDFNIASGSQQEKAATPVIHSLCAFGTIGKPTGSRIAIYNRGSFINSDGEEEQRVDHSSANWRVDLSFYPLRLKYYKLLNNRLVIGFPPTEYTPYETIGIGEWRADQRERFNNYSDWLKQ